MIYLLLTAFMSFSVVNGQSSMTMINSTSELSESQPVANVQTGEHEVEWWWEGFITRHRTIRIGEPEYLGTIEIDQISDNFDARTLKNLHFEHTVSLTEEDSVSTTISASSKTISTIAVKAGLSNFSISGDYSVERAFKIEQTHTYTISTQTETTVSYDANYDLVQGKIFHLAIAAFTYKMECEMWEWRSYWWGNYYVDDSRKSFVTYLTLTPYITLAEHDCTLI